MCVYCDICRLLVSEAVKHLGGIDILILNAAYSPPLKAFVDLDKPVRQASHDHNYVNCHCIGRSVPRCLQVSAKVSLELFGGQIFVVKRIEIK